MQHQVDFSLVDNKPNGKIFLMLMIFRQSITVQKIYFSLGLNRQKICQWVGIIHIIQMLFNKLKVQDFLIILSAFFNHKLTKFSK